MDNQEQTIKRISVKSDDTQANGQSGSSSISDDGRYIPFESNATNLVPNDFNEQTDIFIYDHLNETVELITLAADGSQANGSSSSGSINGNGDYVVFASFADNLVPNDTNGQRDIFVYDRVNRTTELVSVKSDTTQANGLSLFSAINKNGNIVAFESLADNLVPNDTNGQSDIFVYDRVNQNTRRINIGLNDGQANAPVSLGSISDTGRYISFSSAASNLVPNDTNDKSDIFVYDRVNQTTEVVSMGLNNAVANDDSTSGFISGNGSFVVYESKADNLVPNDTNGQSDIFVYDRVNQTTELIDVTVDGTQSDGDSQAPSISTDGNIVAFLSEASNLVSGDTNGRANVFIRDRLNQTTEILDADSFPILSGDAQSLVFNSSLDTLVANDTNDTGDVFLVDLSLEPPVTEPPVTEPPVTEPPVTEPPVTEPPVTEPPVTSRFTTDNVNRFYQFEKGFHFYTTDDNEIRFVQEQTAAGELSYQDELEQFTVLSDDKDALTGETLEGVNPVYRFFNTQTGAHLYTDDENERSFIETTLTNYNFEGIQYYAFESELTDVETIPVFRMLNNDTGSHLYSIDQNELNFIQENLPNFSLENNGNPVFHVFEL